MHLETPLINTTKSQEELFALLKGAKNYKQFMPEGITDFDAGDSDFRFSLKGLPEVRLTLKEAIPSTQVVYTATAAGTSFDLKADITANAPGSSVRLSVDGGLNPMAKMMVKGPLNRFLKSLGSNIGKV